MIIAKAPLRVSFFGGGTDIPAVFREVGGAVISCSIDKYVNVFLSEHKKCFDERIRLNYSQSELVNSRDEIKNDVIRGCLQFLEIDDPIYVGTYSDVPAGSGLGSSSACTVALLKGLHEYRGDSGVSNLQLAKEACQVELSVLRKNIGLQDQYGCALGGVNYLEFGNSVTDDFFVEVERLPALDWVIDEIMADSVLVWTDLQRNAEETLGAQLRKKSEVIEYYSQMVALTRFVKNGFQDTNPGVDEYLGKMRESWHLKQRFAESILPSQIAKLIRELKNRGSRYQKLLGAGNGGFIFATDSKLIIPWLERSNIAFLPLAVDYLGPKVSSF